MYVFYSRDLEWRLRTETVRVALRRPGVRVSQFQTRYESDDDLTLGLCAYVPAQAGQYIHGSIEVHSRPACLAHKCNRYGFVVVIASEHFVLEEYERCVKIACLANCFTAAESARAINVSTSSSSAAEESSLMEKPQEGSPLYAETFGEPKGTPTGLRRES